MWECHEGGKEAPDDPMSAIPVEEEDAGDLCDASVPEDDGEAAGNAVLENRGTLREAQSVRPRAGASWADGNLPEELTAAFLRRMEYRGSDVRLDLNYPEGRILIEINMVPLFCIDLFSY